MVSKLSIAVLAVGAMAAVPAVAAGELTLEQRVAARERMVKKQKRPSSGASE
jgi:hypothetical protein